METGKILSWLPRGFGFISADLGGANVFVHINDIDPGYPYEDVPVGTRVSYEIGPGKKPGKFQAVNVKILEETAARGEAE